MQDALFDLWWGYDDGEGNTHDGSLHDLGFKRVSDLIDETIDAFIAAGWSRTRVDPEKEN